MSDNSDQYRHAVSHALGGFQLIEASLKDFIRKYHKSVQDCLPEGMTYEYTGKDFEDAALGRLVGAFDKMCGNKALVAKLRKLQNQRDHLAHRALTNLYGTASKNFDFAGHVNELLDLATGLADLLRQVLDEQYKLLAATRKQNQT